MSIAEALVAEMRQEGAATRRVLARVPMDEPDWRPHPKAMTMVQLASHIADAFAWTPPILQQTKLTFDLEAHTHFLAAEQEELLTRLDQGIEAAVNALEGRTDEHMMVTWSFIMNGEPVLQLPRVAAVRCMILSHLIHHRGQLTVYLRFKNVPLPAIYGPSADEDAH